MKATGATQMRSIIQRQAVLHGFRRRPAGAARADRRRSALADEGPPETTTIRLAFYPNICLAPTLVAKDLLRAEGFTDIQYVQAPESFTIPGAGRPR